MKPPPVDIVCGGFPCQDISNAGKRVGIDGERSGIWSEFARIIRVLRPRLVFVENVAALTVRGLDRVLGDLASLGFDAEWDVLRAADVGAPHLRARIFILAYANGSNGGWREVTGICREAEGGNGSRLHESRGRGEDVPDADEYGLPFKRRTQQECGETWIEDAPGNVADGCNRSRDASDSPLARREGPRWVSETTRRARSVGIEWWATEPDVGRVAHGIPKRVDRLRCLGNAVVWQQAALAFETLSRRARPTTTPVPALPAEGEPRKETT